MTISGYQGLRWHCMNVLHYFAECCSDTCRITLTIQPQSADPTLVPRKTKWEQNNTTTHKESEKSFSHKLLVVVLQPAAHLFIQTRYILERTKKILRIIVVFQSLGKTFIKTLQYYNFFPSLYLTLSYVFRGITIFDKYMDNFFFWKLQ